MPAVTLEGRFDAAEGPRLSPILRAVIEDAAAGSTINLNLASVNFFDSRALVELLTAHAAARAAGITLTLSAASPVVRILLELTGVNHQLQPAAA